MLRQNQREQDLRPSSNIARVPSTIPRGLPPVTPKASRFGDLNMPSVIEAALQRLREQAERHGTHREQFRPAPHAEVNIPRARSPFNFLGGSGGTEASVSQSSSSSSSSTSSKESSSETVIQSSSIDSSGLSQTLSSSKSSTTDSKQSFSSSRSSHSHSASMSHPNLIAARMSQARRLSNVQPGHTHSHSDPHSHGEPHSHGDLHSHGEPHSHGVLNNISPVLNSVQPAPNNIEQANILPPLPQAAVSNIARATSVLQPANHVNINKGLQFHNKNSESISSSSNSDLSSTALSSDNISVQSSASSSKSATQTKKTVTKTVQETTLVKQEGATSAVADQTALSGILQPQKPPVGSITVQRGPGGMSTITLSDGSGEPVVLRATGPVKIERVVNAAGKVQFLINPLTPSAIGRGEKEGEFEAEEIVTTTTPRSSKRLLIPTTTSFPIPWSTTRRPPPPRPPPEHLIGPPQMPVFQSVLNQMSEIANSISRRTFSSASVVNKTNTNTISKVISEKTNVNTDMSNINMNNGNVDSSETLMPQDPGFASGTFITNSGGVVIRPPISQTLLNPSQGTIPISRTLVNSAVGDAGPVLKSQKSSNRATVINNIPAHDTQFSHSLRQDGSVTREVVPKQSNAQPNTVDSINTMFSGQGNAGPLPPYIIKGQSQNSLPS